MTLTPQEIRHCLNHGDFTNLLEELNKNELWRDIYGPVNRRLKDRELILRFLALYFDLAHYERPMTEFLNSFMSSRKHLSEKDKEVFNNAFDNTIGLVHDAIGSKAFRPERPLNAAVYDAVMVGLAKRFKSGPSPQRAAIKHRYAKLLENSDFQAAFQRSTSDEESVRKRIQLAKEVFADT